jgi:hypothetical protein
MKASYHPVVLAFVLCIWIAADAVVLADPGFGLLKKRKVTLQVRRPAAVRLANTSIAFRTGVANQAYTPVGAPLEATLETELISNERTLVKKSPAAADWTMSLTVTAFSIPQPKTRTQPIKNKTPLTFVRWTGSLKVAYQVVDRAGRVHAADNVAASYDKEFQTNIPTGGFKLPSAIPFVGDSKSDDAPQSQDDVMQKLVKDVVSQVAIDLGNTVQPIEAQVAGGQDNLDRAGDFMEQRLWARAVEELEKTPSFAKPEDESYRQYDLGLAYEAMSYEAKTYGEQRASLFKAQEYYDQATELNRKQRYFVEVVARLKESLARYRTLDAMQRDDQKKPAPQKAEIPPPPPSPPAAASVPAAPRSATPASARNAAPAAGTASQSRSKPLTVRDVIELHTAGVQSQQIVEVIRSSQVQFNFLDKDTLLAIARAKLPLELQNEMRKKAGLAPLSATPR